jgi:hypothetical protein
MTLAVVVCSAGVAIYTSSPVLRGRVGRGRATATVFADF